MPNAKDYPVAAWVAALEAAVRAGDYRAAAQAADQLRRRGVELRLLSDRPRPIDRESATAIEGHGDAR